MNSIKLIPLKKQPLLTKEIIQNASGIQIKMYYDTPLIINLHPGDCIDDKEIVKILDVKQNGSLEWCLECAVI